MQLILLVLRRICNNQPLAAFSRLDGDEKTVSQLSAAGCRTLWLDHGPHSEPAAVKSSDSAETDTSEDRSGESTRESSRDISDESSRESSGKKSRGKPGKKSRGKSGESSRGNSGEISSGGATNVSLAGKRGKADGGGGDERGEERGESSRYKGRLSMVLDVRGDGGSARMVGLSEWLLR